MDKHKVAEILIEIGTLLELKVENPFKTRAYQNGARVIESLTEPLEQIIADGRLGELKGIGEALQEKITALMQTGRLAYFEELKASIPAGLVEMLNIPGVGPKKVRKLHDELGLKSVAQLEEACKAGKIAGLEGFGE